MEIRRRFIVVAFGFFGLLISIGYRTIFAMTMVQVIVSNHGISSVHDIFGSSCNKTESDFSADISVSFSQYLNTAFFVGTLCTQVPGGYLATRFSPSRVCGISILISSIIMLLFPTIIKFDNKWLLIAVRIIQGISEGSSVPALNGVISAWAPKSEKARMITTVYAGAYLSPAVASILSGFLACWFVWYFSLYLYGGLGVLWVVAWLFFIYDTPHDHPSLGVNEQLLFHTEGANVRRGNSQIAGNIPWLSMLTCMPIYAIFVGSFCRNWIFSMLTTGIQQYFKDVFKSSIATIGIVTAAPEVLMTITTVAGGLFVDMMIKSEKWSTTFGRKFAQTLGFGVEGGCIFALAFVRNQTVAVVLLCVGVGVSGFAISGYQVNVIDLAPQYASIITGFIRFGSAGAVLGTMLTGTLRENMTDTTWRNLLIIAGSIHISGVIFYAIFAKGTRMSWAQKGKVTERDRLINPAADRIGVGYVDDSARNERFSQSEKFNSTPTDTDLESDDDTPSWFLNTI